MTFAYSLEMASLEEDQDTISNPTPSVRSILKKVDSETDVPQSSKEKRKQSKSISFDKKVTMHFSDANVEANLSSIDGEDEGVSNGELGVTSESSLALAVDDSEGSEVSSGGREVTVKLKAPALDGVKGGGIKAKVGSMLRRSSLSRGSRTRSQGDSPAQGGTPSSKGDHTPSESTTSPSSSMSAASGPEGTDEATTSRLKGGASDMFSTSGSYLSSSLSSRFAGKTRSLPRTISADSADLFSRRNKSLRSQFVRFGKFLKSGGGGGGGDDSRDEPVLTKVTPLGGSCSLKFLHSSGLSVSIRQT